MVSRHPATQATGLLTLTPAGLSPAEHASLRWTHNRTCGFIRLSDGRRLQAHAARAARTASPETQACSGVASSSSKGGYRLAPLSRPLSPFASTSEVRPLSSAGVTRHHRYYEPVRHPIRPGLSLTGVRLVNTHHRWGFPCCDGPLYTCRRQYPGGTVGCTRCCLFPTTGPSPADNRVGSRINVFEACSAFTARYGLHTRGVAWRPFTPEASEISLPTSLLRLLPTVATLVGLGLSPSGDPRLPTAHCQLPFIFLNCK